MSGAFLVPEGPGLLLVALSGDMILVWAMLCLLPGGVCRDFEGVLHHYWVKLSTAAIT